MSIIEDRPSPLGSNVKPLEIFELAEYDYEQAAFYQMEDASVKRSRLKDGDSELIAAPELARFKIIVRDVGLVLGYDPEDDHRFMAARASLHGAARWIALHPQRLRAADLQEAISNAPYIKNQQLISLLFIEGLMDNNGPDETINQLKTGYRDLVERDALYAAQQGDTESLKDCLNQNLWPPQERQELKDNISNALANRHEIEH